LIPNSRKRYRIDYAVSLKNLIDNPNLADDTVVSRITGAGGNSAAITRKALLAYLLESFGKDALEQLIDRRLIASAAVRTEVTRQISLDRGGPGFINPKMFMRIDNPTIFAAVPQTLAPGDIVPQPLELGGSQFVLRLEGRFPAEMMTAQEREAALRRINGGR